MAGPFRRAGYSLTIADSPLTHKYFTSTGVSGWLATRKRIDVSFVGSKGA